MDQWLIDRFASRAPVAVTAIRRLTGVKADPIRGYHTFVIDGKTYNATEHRLKESRIDARAPLPGRAVALFDTRYEMFVDIQCDANAHRCERKIVEPLLDRLLAGALYLADRNFSDGIVLQRFFDAGAFFIVRQHGACPAWQEIAGQKSKAGGVDSQGGKVSQQNIQVQLADGSWQKVRRVSVKLAKPTRDGDLEIHLLTNLRSAVAARKVSDAYRARWTIETCLGHLSRALNAEIRSLCYPGAAGLCFVLALVLFNLMSMIKSTLLKYGQHDHRYDVRDLSYYYLADEILRTQSGLEIATNSEQWSRYAAMPLKEFTRFWTNVAKFAKLARYRKHARAPTKRAPKRKFTGARHTATQKYLDARK